MEACSNGLRLPPAWVEPLEAVARAVAGDPLYPFFDTDDFMIMARLLRRPRPSIVLYKHYYTRRYLNLDDAGHAYRYIGPRDANSQSDGRTSPTRICGSRSTSSSCGSSRDFSDG